MPLKAAPSAISITLHIMMAYIFKMHVFFIAVIKIMLVLNNSRFSKQMLIGKKINKIENNPALHATLCVDELQKTTMHVCRWKDAINNTYTALKWIKPNHLWIIQD